MGLGIIIFSIVLFILILMNKLMKIFISRHKIIQSYCASSPVVKFPKEFHKRYGLAKAVTRVRNVQSNESPGSRIFYFFPHSITLSSVTIKLTGTSCSSLGILSTTWKSKHSPILMAFGTFLRNLS